MAHVTFKQCLYTLNFKTGNILYYTSFSQNWNLSKGTFPSPIFDRFLFKLISNRLKKFIITQHKIIIRTISGGGVRKEQFLAFVFVDCSVQTRPVDFVFCGDSKVFSSMCYISSLSTNYSLE